MYVCFAFKMDGLVRCVELGKCVAAGYLMNPFTGRNNGQKPSLYCSCYICVTNHCPYTTIHFAKPSEACILDLVVYLYVVELRDWLQPHGKFNLDQGLVHSC